MGKKHRPKKEQYERTARDSRKGVHVYHAVDDFHRIASSGGRCWKCGCITDAFCDMCSRWSCAKHLSKKNEFDICEECLGKNDGKLLWP